MTKWKNVRTHESVNPYWKLYQSPHLGTIRGLYGASFSSRSTFSAIPDECTSDPTGLSREAASLLEVTRRWRGVRQIVCTQIMWLSISYKYLFKKKIICLSKVIMRERLVWMFLFLKWECSSVNWRRINFLLGGGAGQNGAAGWCGSWGKKSSSYNFRIPEIESSVYRSIDHWFPV